MNLIILSLYYPPDGEAPGLFLEELVECLVADGHQVTVLSGARRVGRENVGADGNVEVRRVWSTHFGRKSLLAQLTDHAAFCLGSAWVLLWLRQRPERIVALTPPPFLSLLARVMSKFHGGNHGHWVMDLYPDVLVAAGMISKAGVIAQTIGFLTRLGFGGNRCAFVSTLGLDMAERGRRYLPEGQKMEVLPLWALKEVSSVRGEAVRAWREKWGWETDVLVLMYSGNMGLGHRFKDFLQVAELIRGEADKHLPSASHPSKLCFVFTGDGKRKKEIEDFVARRPDGLVSVGNHVPRSDLAVHLASADVHLVSLDPAWDGTMSPSKLQGIFAAGRPVIFVGTRTCAIGQWILESGGGWVVEPGDIESLRAAVEKSRDVKERVKRGEAARKFAQEQFCREKNAGKLARLFG